MKDDDIDNAIGDRHVLIAVDDSKKAERAVLYAADFLGGVPGFRATVITVIPEPPEDYFSTDEERKVWLKDHRSEAEKMLDRYREVLIQSGFGKDKVRDGCGCQGLSVHCGLHHRHAAEARMLHRYRGKARHIEKGGVPFWQHLKQGSTFGQELRCVGDRVGEYCKVILPALLSQASCQGPERPFP